MIANIIYLLLAFLGLGILIFIHELGHYFAAKKVGMKVEVFSIGFGRPIYFWDRKDGVRWQICILPFGGYVKIAGMEKKGSLEPYEIKDGFFGKKPIDRIKVSLAGPFVNIIFAFLVFSLIWGVGGRKKPFAEVTKKIGLVDNSSDLYEKGVKAGDEITYYKNKKYQGAKDLIYGGISEDSKINIKGNKIDYFEGVKKTPYDYTLDAYKYSFYDQSLYTVGVFFPAEYLIFDEQNSNLEISPLKNSGIKDGDRILWVNGKLIFSRSQLSHIINDNYAYVTIQRGRDVLHYRVEKFATDDLALNKFELEQIEDWRYEGKVFKKINELKFFPYYFNENGTIVNKVELISSYKENNQLDRENLDLLQKGDKIIAVDGVLVNSAQDILKAIQKKHVLMLVQRAQSENNLISYEKADSEFDKVFKTANLKKVIKSIGGDISILSQDSDLVMLKPVKPISFEEIITASANSKEILDQIEKKEKEIKALANDTERQRQLKLLTSQKNELKLGIMLYDKEVKYNPGPLSLFTSAFTDVYRTFSSLITGKVNPKFLAGPIGIMQVIHRSWSVGILEALFWLGVISLNLGIINLLPIPVLDGGHIVFSIVEMFTKKPLKTKTMEKIIIPFVVLLILAFIFFTYNDIVRIIKSFF